MKKLIFLLGLLFTTTFLVCCSKIEFDDSIYLHDTIEQVDVKWTINNDCTILTIVNDESIYNVECNSKEDLVNYLKYIQLHTFDDVVKIQNNASPIKYILARKYHYYYGPGIKKQEFIFPRYFLNYSLEQLQ